MDTEKLKALALAACPFCGAQPKIRTEMLDERFAYADRVIVQCSSCECKRSAVGDTSKPGYADNSTTERRAIEAWNRRSAPAAGTDQDAEDAARYRKLFEMDTFLCLPNWWRVVDWMSCTPSRAKKDLDAKLDSIGRTKAGTEPAQEIKAQVLPAEWAKGQPAIAPGMVEVQENYDRAQLQALGQHREKP